MRSFPERFDFAPDVWKGPRAKNFTRREDAFQRLVGSALRTELGSFVRDVPTEGADGAIDVFVEAGAPTCALLPAVLGATIVECKDNDETRSGWVDNVLAAWKKVAKKVECQAKAGWPGRYAPWERASAYVYVTSARLTQNTRDKLTGLVETYFRRLQAEGRCRIERVRVVDWSDLHELLGRHPRLADDWLGAPSSVLVGHEERESVFASDFGRYLKDIPFVPPDSSSETHPDRIFEMVAERAQEGGVLVVGPGGVGKTRLLFEVARRASVEGWRVLHAIEGESPLRYEQLAEELLYGRGNVLVIGDYFDRLKPEIRTIKRRLLPEAAKRELRIAFLASARLRERVIETPDAETFFRVVEIRTDAGRARKILAEMEQQVAPTAVRLLGREHIDELLGEVPVIALLFLCEVERRAKEGTLDVASLRGVRPSDLEKWVRRRLHEDDLLVPVTEARRRALSIDPRSIAAAAILAASPLSETQAHQLAVDLFERVAGLNGENALTRADAEDRVDTLCDLGWLSVRDGQLVTCHDVVTDQMLLDVLRDGRGRLRDDLVKVILGPAAESPRLLGRFAVSLGRLFGSLGTFEPVLQDGMTRWFEQDAAKIGPTLGTADAADAAYALRSVLSGPPWADVLPSVWDRVVEPWRQRHVEAEASWPVHVAMLGRRDLSREQAASTVQMAMVWVGKHGGTEEAAVVLVYLLDRVDLDDDTESRATTAALLWHEGHRDTEMAPSVLGMVLLKGRVATATASSTARAILDWCRGHRAGPSSGFALGVLLSRDDLGPELQPEATTTALEWLKEYEDTDEAGFVVASFLARDEALPVSVGDLVGRSLAWCESHRDALGAGFVLNAVLGRDALPAGLAAPAAQLAYQWIEGRKERPFEAGIVLASLLLSAEISATQLDVLGRTAITWLERYGSYPQSMQLLQHLLMRMDLSHALQIRIEHAAIEWCEAHADQATMGFILGVLLEKPLETATMDRVVAASKTFLEEHRESHVAAMVLGMLLSKPEVALDDALRPRERAIAWLTEHPDEDIVGFILMGMLSADEPGDTDPQTMKWATDWLANRCLEPVAVLVLVPLLGKESCSGEVTSTATDWLEKHCQWREAIVLLQQLSTRAHSDATTQHRVERLAYRWLEIHSRRVEALGAFQCLLRQSDLREPDTTAQFALQWLGRQGTRIEAKFLLSALLRRSDLAPSLTSRTLGFAFEWLALHGADDEADVVLYPLLHRRDLEDQAASSCVRIVLAWTDKHGSDADATGNLLDATLMFLVRNSTLRETAHARPRALARAHAWLDAHPDSDLAGRVLTRIFLHPDVDPETASRAADRAFDWLEHHEEAFEAWLPISGLLEYRRGEDPRAERAAHACVTWIEAHGDQSEADLVLRNFHYFAGFTANSAIWMGFFSLTWLAQYARPGGSHLLFDLFYEPSEGVGMAEEYARQLIKTQLSLLSKTQNDDDLLPQIALALAALLPLARNKGTARQAQQSRSLARKIAQDARLSEEAQQACVRACYRLVDAGAWASREEAERTLSRVGFRRLS